MKPLLGIHHVTAITADAQANADFYTGVLGLRLVKKTVNFDDPGSYHLYYGDETGSPGSLITFFAWPGAHRGSVGSGEPVAIALGIPADSLEDWAKRIKVVDRGERFDAPYIATQDPDGIRIELIADPDITDTPRIHSVSLNIANADKSKRLFETSLGFRAERSESGRERFRIGDSFIDIVSDGSARSRMGAGTIHHIAFRVEDDPTQLEWLRRLTALDLPVSPVMDRKYFHSIYFREPGHVLFEIATDPPGMAVDEALDKLGEGLQLPSEYESLRSKLERTLTPLKVAHA